VVVRRPGGLPVAGSLWGASAAHGCFHNMRRPYTGRIKKGPAPRVVPSVVLSASNWTLAAGPHQLDSGVGAGFWLYEVCMYVYGKS
jgi:hypothetical protein